MFEWLLIISMNSTEGGQTSHAPSVVPGFSSEARCKDAGQKISWQLIRQSGLIADSKGRDKNENPPYVWSDCIQVQK